MKRDNSEWVSVHVCSQGVKWGGKCAACVCVCVFALGMHMQGKKGKPTVGQNEESNEIRCFKAQWWEEREEREHFLFSPYLHLNSTKHPFTCKCSIIQREVNLLILCFTLRRQMNKNAAQTSTPLNRLGKWWWTHGSTSGEDRRRVHVMVKWL